MTNTPLLTPEELNDLMSRVDGDGIINAFTPFEFALLLSHLKVSNQLDYTSSWYLNAFNALVEVGILNEDGSITGSVLHLYLSTYGMPLYTKEPSEEIEGQGNLW